MSTRKARTGQPKRGKRPEGEGEPSLEPVAASPGPAPEASLEPFFAALAEVAQQEGQLVAALSRVQQATHQPSAAVQKLFDCARQLQGIARASSSDDRVAAAARIVEAIWLALRRGDDAALRSWLSMGSKNAPSPHRYLIESPPRSDEGWSASDGAFDRDRAVREVLSLAASTINDHEPAMRIGEMMAWGVAAWFPALCTTSELQLKKRVIAAQRIALFALGSPDAPPDQRAPTDPEKLAIESLVAFGVDRSSARGWIRVAQGERTTWNESSGDFRVNKADAES
jgi:hypothetical protein